MTVITFETRKWRRALRFLSRMGLLAVADAGKWFAPRQIAILFDGDTPFKFAYCAARCAASVN